MKEKLKIFIKTFPAEGYIWILSIIILAVSNVNAHSHFSVCPLNNLGFNFCPGCGLGKSIHYFVNFNFTASFQAHPLGGVTFIILIHRIIVLVKRSLPEFKSQKL